MPTFNITAPDGTMYRVAAPEGATEQDALARVQEQHVASPPQTANGRIGDDFASLPRSPGSLMDTREVPRPGAPGGNYLSDITQRARNTAFGQGPGSVAGSPAQRFLLRWKAQAPSAARWGEALAPCPIG
jgi:hypothetical protein